MADYKLSNTEKVIYWKEVIIGYLSSKDTQQASPAEFLAKYPHADTVILTQAVAQLVSEGKIEQV